ncbi:MAG: mechanosensitive ion channel family protein [Anaerolineales bacterium]
MISQRSLIVLTTLLASAMVSACSTPVPTSLVPEDSTPPEASTIDAAAIVIERTPVPTSKPDRLTQSVDDFGKSIGADRVIFLGLTGTDWINLGISWLIVLASYGIGGIVARVILPRLTRRVPKPYDREIRGVVSPKIRQLFGLFGLWFATQRLEFLGADIKVFLYDLYFVVALIISTQIALKLIDVGAHYYTDRIEPPERQAEMSPIISLLARLAYGVVIIVAVAAGLDRFGINITALAAALGIAGLGFALAAQDTIADAIAGMLILADRPFRVGDRINIDAIGTWGDVVDIGLRTTRIRTRDNRLVIVPNSTISKNEVVNFSYPDPRYRIQTHVGIGYDADFERARHVMIDAVRNTEGVLQDKPIEALYIEMADSDMKFRVRWWIDSYVDTRRMLDAIHTALQNALDEAGFQQAYPVRELRHQMDSEQESDLKSGLGKPGDIEIAEDQEDQE